jgi:hypothetical protein
MIFWCVTIVGICALSVRAGAEDPPAGLPTPISIEQNLAGKRGTFTWDVPTGDGRGPLPVTFTFPMGYHSESVYPLAVHLGRTVALGDSRAAGRPNIAMVIPDRQGTNYLGLGATDAFAAIRSAVNHLNVDRQCVVLVAAGGRCTAALRLAARWRDLLAALVLDEPTVHDQVSDNLLGLPILLLYRSPRVDRVPNVVAALSQQLTRAGAVVDLLGVPDGAGSQEQSVLPQPIIEAWIFAHSGLSKHSSINLLSNDPLYGLYDGRPIRIIVPTEGDEAYLTAVNRMGRFLSVGGNLACAIPGKGAAASAGGCIPIIRDIDITGRKVRAHWIVLGSPATNVILADQLASAPVRIEDGWIVLTDVKKRYPSSRFGFVYSRPNARDARWRVHIVAASRKEFFETHIGSSLVPNTDLPLARRRPDLTVLHVHTEAMAGLWFTDSLGRIMPSADSRRIPANVETWQQLHRLEAEAARLATDSRVSFAATESSIATRPIIDAERLNLTGLLCLIGNQPIVIAELPAEQLELAVLQAHQAPNVVVLPSRQRSSTKPDRTYCVAIPMQQLEAVSARVPGLRSLADLRVADQTIRDGVMELFGKPGDLNRDQSIDLDDLVFFRRCYTGPVGHVTVGCRLADLNGDGAVDATDLHVLKQGITEPGSAIANTSMTAEDLEDWISNVSP